MKLIIYIFIFFIIFRFVSWLTIRFLAYRVRKASKTGNSFSDESHTPSSKKKKISKDKGDYVDFEEME